MKSPSNLTVIHTPEPPEPSDFDKEVKLRVLRILELEQDIKRRGQLIADLQRSNREDNAAVEMQRKLILDMFAESGVASSPIDTHHVFKTSGKTSLKIDEAGVPDEFKKVELVVDKDKIKQALDEGKGLNFAAYVQGDEFLTIKAR